MRVLICGGGVIGASIAYFLSCRGIKPIVIERTGLACAALAKSPAPPGSTVEIHYALMMEAGIDRGHGTV